MIEAKIERVRKIAATFKIKPRPCKDEMHTEIVGFDTEYTSKKNKLICFQLWYKEKGVLVECLPGENYLTPEILYEEACRLIGKPVPHITFATYFSAAELQFLPVIDRGYDIMEYARGFADVTFRIDIPGKLLDSEILITDVSRWFDGKSLDAAAKSFGLKKMKFDTTKVTRRCLDDPKFVEYAKHDAYLCYAILTELRRTAISHTGIDPLMVKTPASLAAETFRNLYVTETLFNDDSEAKYIGMKGTWGGRAEVFKRGRFKKLVREYDIKSAYPNSIINLGVVPACGDDWKVVTRPNQVTKYIGGFGRAYFKFPKTVRYPVLPVFTGNSMLYPLEGETFCTFAEFEVALELGAKICFVEAYGYNTGTPVLSEFLKWTLAERAKAKKTGGALEVMYKLLGNSLLGKMSQGLSKISIDEYKRVRDELSKELGEEISLEEMFTLTKWELLELGALERVSVGSVFMPEYFGLATGYTRAELGYALNTCNPYYCHTDSIWTTTKPKPRKLEWELSPISGPCTVIRTRFAALGDFKTFKKVKAKKGKIAFHSIWSAPAAVKILNQFDGDTFIHVYKHRKPMRFKEAIRRGVNHGHWIEDSRKGSTKWDHKRILINGNDTAPYAHVTDHLEIIKK